MRILIVGGLGYIGSELIEQYKAQNNSNLTVDIIDKQFIPHIAAGLPRNFRFIHADMKDDAIMTPLLNSKPDIIYLLAAEVQAESSINRERVIWENNFEAIVKIVDRTDLSSRIIFASTGNVFGGVNEKEKYMNLTEEDEPRPKYPYAESKRAVEKHLLASDKNFVICRFGTNYGYSPGIRFNLVTNNFIKKALEGKTITIHGKGENFRPTVCVKDVARAALFLSTHNDAKGEIFHVVCENFKIRELAQKVAAINPSTTIEYIAKEAPFSSYHLSSEKIKKLGFSFTWNLAQALDDMGSIFSCLRTGEGSKVAL